VFRFAAHFSKLLLSRLFGRYKFLRSGVLKMVAGNKTYFTLLALSITFLSGCAALDIKPWSAGDIVDGVMTTTVTGNSTSYGNEATCNHYKMKCASRYREWVKDGEIACSCVDD